MACGWGGGLGFDESSPGSWPMIAVFRTNQRATPPAIFFPTRCSSFRGLRSAQNKRTINQSTDRLSDCSNVFAKSPTVERLYVPTFSLPMFVFDWFYDVLGYLGA